MRENNRGSDFVFFVLGGLAGASVALLLTPRSGRETRELVAARMRDGERYARRRLERGGQVVARTVQEGRQIAKRTIAKGRDAAEAGYAAVVDQPGRNPAPAEKLT